MIMTMERFPTKYEVQQLVACDDLVRAIQKIISVARRNSLDCLDEAIVLSRELYSLEKTLVIEGVKWEDEKMMNNQLAYRILKLAYFLDDNNGAITTDSLN